MKNPLRGRNIKLPGYFSPVETPVNTECSEDSLLAVAPAKTAEDPLMTRQGEAEQLLPRPGLGPPRPRNLDVTPANGGNNNGLKLCSS